MKLSEIKAIAAESTRTNEIIHSLCKELLAVHEVNDRMAAEIARLAIENATLRDLASEPIVGAEPVDELGDSSEEPTLTDFSLGGGLEDTLSYKNLDRPVWALGYAPTNTAIYGKVDDES